MKIIDTYVAKIISYYYTLALIFLTGVQLFINLMSEFPRLGTGQYHLAEMLSYIALSLPYEVYQFFPLVGLLGAIFALSLLATNHELTIMRASGMSVFGIGKIVLKIGAFWVCLMFVMGEAVAPIALHQAEQLRTKALSQGRALLTHDGMWLYDGDEVIQIGSKIGDKLRDITKYRINEDHQLTEVMFAPVARYTADGWQLQRVRGTKLMSQQSEPSKEAIQPLTTLRLNADLAGLTTLKSDQKNLRALYYYIKYRKQSGLAVEEYRFNFWQRVVAPLAAIVMFFFAVPFVFGSLRSATMGLRMVLSVAIGFLFYLANQFLGPISQLHGFNPLLSALMPALLFAAVGLWLWHRAR